MVNPSESPMAKLKWYLSKFTEADSDLLVMNAITDIIV